MADTAGVGSQAGPESKPSPWRQAWMSVLWTAIAFVVCTAAFVAYVAMLPKVEEKKLQEKKLKVLVANLPPASLNGLKELRDIVVEYGTQHPVRMGTTMAMLYILMQSFSIPGTASIGMLSGALFGTLPGFIFTALVSTTDILFLRLTPILPNFFISSASPIVGVPLGSFALATLLGCAPNNFMAARAGAQLGELQSMSDLYDKRMVGLLALVAVIAVLPIIVKARSESAKKKIE
eukprot:gene10470-8430_t